MGVRLKKGAIYLFNCDLDGFTNSSNRETKHFFIILSHEVYNQRMNSFLGAGLSSKVSQSHYIKFIMEDFPEWAGAIASGKYDRFSGVNQIEILVDKVTRLKESDLLFRGRSLSTPLLMIKEDKYEELIDAIGSFMLIPNNDINV